MQKPGFIEKKEEAFVVQVNWLMKAYDPVALLGKELFTEEEYLEFEQVSPVKHEYVRGLIIAMPATRLAHHIIAGNIFSALSHQLKNKNCRLFNDEHRIYIPQGGIFTYPDSCIVYGAVDTRNNDGQNILNPSVIIEVMSPDSKNHDRVEKFTRYRLIQSFLEYVLVDAAAFRVEVWQRNHAFNWTPHEYTSLDEKVEINTVQAVLTMKDIYLDISFRPVAGNS